MADSNRFAQWKNDVQSTNMIVVLNAMNEIAQTGDWSALGLLTLAGDNVIGIAKQLSIKTPRGKFQFSEFREHCIQQLQERLGVKPADRQIVQPPPRLFISYSHQDREAANGLALELAKSNVNVFLDHWEMAPHEPILPRIERELQASDVVVALLSRSSAASLWVQRELEIITRRQEASGNVILLPVLLENCNIPEAIAARPYHDLRDSRSRPIVAQAILNQTLGIRPLSERVLEFLGKADLESPYQQQAQHNGRRLLQELAKHQDLEIANNQKWLLWALFHKLLVSYKCTLKMGVDQSSATKYYSFVIVDRWNQTWNPVQLTGDEFDRGLWQGEIDLLGRRTLRSKDMKLVGSLARFSRDAGFNPNVEENTAEATAQDPVQRILRSFLQLCETFDEGSRQSFLFDYQRLVIPGDWHRIKVLAGSTGGGNSHTVSHLPPAHDDVCSVFEVYDPFFSSLKYTQAYKSELIHSWEGDVDLMSGATRTQLGLS
jgi:TIR domain